MQASSAICQIYVYLQMTMKGILSASNPVWKSVLKSLASYYSSALEAHPEELLEVGPSEGDAVAAKGTTESQYF